MNKFRLLLLAIVLSSFSATACEMPIFLAEFKINKKIKAPLPIKPNFKVANVIRAVRADTCRFGIGEIELKLNTVPKIHQGYIFEVAKGKIDKGFTFKNPVVSSFVKNAYHLEFNDGNTNTQEPFNIVLKIIGVSRSGEKSTPQFLKISNAGVKVPWWNVWKKLPYSVTQVIEYM